MKISPLINTAEVPEIENFWGENQRYKRKHISKALGSGQHGSPLHLFDVEMTKILPKHHNCPQHAHPEMAEFFIIVSGQGMMYRNDEEYEIKAGDCFYQAPGTYHRLFNTSETDHLVFFVIANEVEESSLDILRS